MLLISAPVLADLPLTVENLITDKGKIKFELSVTYANTDRKGVCPPVRRSSYWSETPRTGIYPDS